MYLFIDGDGQELDKSLNHQLTHSELWLKLMAQNSNKVSYTGNLVDTGNTANQKLKYITLAPGALSGYMILGTAWQSQSLSRGW